MKLTKDEITKYLVVVFAIGIVKYLLPNVWAIWIIFNPGKDFFFYLDYPVLKTWGLAFYKLVTLLGIGVSTAFVINLSERRKGYPSTVFWQLTGLVFGLIGFLAYVVWDHFIITGVSQLDVEDGIAEGIQA